MILIEYAIMWILGCYISNIIYDSSTVSYEQDLIYDRLNVMKNKQGFLYFYKLVLVKKLVHE